LRGIKTTNPMKKFLLATAMLFSVFMSAQESFPANHPELLKGKDVKIVPTIDTESRGLEGFFTKEDLTEVYMPGDNKSYTRVDALLGKQFKVNAIDKLTFPGSTSEYTRITLQGQEGQILYYSYNSKYDFKYPFEVIGGLTLPEGFYCDYITKQEYGTNVRYTAMVAIGTSVTKSVAAGKASYSMSFAVYGDKDPGGMISKVTLALENNKTIVDNNQSLFAEMRSATSYKYSFTVLLSDAQIQLLAQNKLIGIKAGPLVLPFENATKLQGVIKCIQNLK